MFDPDGRLLTTTSVGSSRRRGSACVPRSALERVRPVRI